MKNSQLKRSSALMKESLDEKKYNKLIGRFSKLWEEEDDDKTVVAKYRAARAESLASMRLELGILEAATYERLKEK